MRGAVTVAGLLFLATQPLAAESRIVFRKGAGDSSNLQPSTEVAWLWVDHRLSDYALLITHGTEITPDANADGQVELEVPAGVSPLLVWVAVDLTTGSVAAKVPLNLIVSPDTQKIADGLKPAIDATGGKFWCSTRRHRRFRI